MPKGTAHAHARALGGLVAEFGLRAIGGKVMGLRVRNDEDAAHFEQSWKANRGEHVYR